MNNERETKIEVKHKPSSTKVRVGLGLAAVGTVVSLAGCGGESTVDTTFEGPTDMYVVEVGDTNWRIAQLIKENVSDPNSRIEPYVDKVSEQVKPSDLQPYQGIQLPVAADLDPTRPGIQLRKSE